MTAPLFSGLWSDGAVEVIHWFQDTLVLSVATPKGVTRLELSQGVAEGLAVEILRIANPELHARLLQEVAQ